MNPESDFKIAHLNNYDKLVQRELRGSIVDFLNLLFGASDETDKFWKEILIPRTAEYFDYVKEDL